MKESATIQLVDVIHVSSPRKRVVAKSDLFGGAYYSETARFDMARTNVLLLREELAALPEGSPSSTALSDQLASTKRTLVASRQGRGEALQAACEVGEEVLYIKQPQNRAGLTSFKLPPNFESLN